MQDIIHADIFFFITSIAVVIFTIIAAIVGMYMIGIMRDVRQITRRVRDGVEHVSASAEKIVDDVRNDGIVSTISKFGHREAKKRRVTK